MTDEVYDDRHWKTLNIPQWIRDAPLHVWTSCYPTLDRVAADHAAFMKEQAYDDAMKALETINR